jgi:hypothetical protein
MKDEKVFGKIGLNLDDDPRYFGVNDTDLIQNMLPNMEGEAGLEETHPGNISIPSGFVYGGGIKTIGTCKDPRTNYIYIFVKADDPSTDGNSILQYDPISETYRKIVFEEVNLPMGANVYGAVVFGDYIIYNTLSVGLRKVHIDYANRYYNIALWAAGVYEDGDLVRLADGSCYVCIDDTAGGDGSPETEPTHWAFEYYTYPSITDTTFVLRNMPPVDRPTIAYATDSARFINNLLKKTFQFAYRYKYVDGGFSVYSEYSDIALSPNIENWDGNLVFELYDYNKIAIGFTRGEKSIVEYVEIIVREGNNGTWRLFKTITDDVSTIDFFNDEKYESVDQDEVLMAEDAVPRSCADMALINENRIVIARPTEGFDNVVLDATLTPVVEAVTLTAAADAELTFREIVDEGVDGESYCDIDVSSWTTPVNYGLGDILRISFEIHGDAYDLDYTLIAADVASLAALSALIVSKINGLITTKGTARMIDAPGQPASAWNVTNNDDYDIEIVMTSVANSILGGSVKILDATITNDVNKWNTYKSDAVHPHGIEYFDAEFRHSSVQTSTALELVVKARSSYSLTLSYRLKLDWTIAHLAPSWAKYWRWVYAGNKTQALFVQYIIEAAAPGVAPYDSFVGFDISPLQLLKTDTAPDVSLLGSIIDPYVFAEGDRVRILTGVEAGAALGTLFERADYYDLPISAFDSTTNTIYVPKPAAGTYGAGAGSLIEIYTPRTFEEDVEPFFPVGPIYAVLSGGYHTAKQRAGVVISSSADNGAGLVRFATATAHGLIAGDWVRISGTVDYNGDFKVSLASDGTHFDLTRSYVAPSQTGVATPLAYGTLESGDAWLLGRAFSRNVGAATTGTLFPVESMHYSDFYLSDVWDKGKPAIQSSIGEVTQNNIRWGLKHLTGASVDNMFTFDPLDYKSTTEIYGDLERIGECGDILRLLFNKKIASCYIGKTEYIDTEGSSVVATANNVLSNPNYSIDDYGTTVPEAVLFVKGILYFIDLYNGAIIRTTNNGSYPISGKVDASDDSPDYKMQSYFRAICAQVLDAQLIVQGGTTDGHTLRLLLGWDNGRKLLYVSILQENIENRTLAFSESRGRWVAFLDFYQLATGYYPSCYEWVSDKFLSFLDHDDSVWDHSSPSSTDLLIYGEAKIATISDWCVVHPTNMKVYDSIAVHTNASGWYGSVFIPPSLSYPVGMESRLIASKFKRMENALYATYMFNGLSAGATFSVLGLYNGESLRGYMIENRLSIASAARLFKVDVSYRISPV